MKVKIFISQFDRSVNMFLHIYIFMYIHKTIKPAAAAADGKRLVNALQKLLFFGIIIYVR